MSIYKKTNIEENMNYSIIKGGILNFSRQLVLIIVDKIRINSIVRWSKGTCKRDFEKTR